MARPVRARYHPERWWSSVPQFVCVDGPLSGQQFDWPKGSRTGQILTIALVDVGQPEVAPEEEPEAEYRIERTADEDLPGRLRFVAGRGPWRAASSTSLQEV